MGKLLGGYKYVGSHQKRYRQSPVLDREVNAGEETTMSQGSPVLHQ
jgi:hypothetical protein